MVNLTGRLILTAELQANHARELLGKGVTDDGDHSSGTTGDHWEGEGIIAADHIETLGFHLDDFVDLLQRTASLLDGNDVLAVVSQSDGGLGAQVDTGSTRHIVEHHRER